MDNRCAVAESARSLHDTEAGPAATAPSPELDREVELRLAMLRHWYRDQLTGEQWNEVRRQIRSDVVAVSQALAEVPLDHTDEPLPLFTPYRSDA